MVALSPGQRLRVDERYKEFEELSKKVPGICSANNPNRRPEWLDEELMAKARSVAKKYFASLFLCHFAGLLLLVQMPTLLVPVFATTSHNTIAKLFKRYLDTFDHIKKWYENDIFSKDSSSGRSIKKVNLLHRQVYSKVNPEETNSNHGKLFMTQFDMVVTQWSSIAPAILFPKEFGLHHITDDELLAIVHYWRAIGYSLGIEDRFNCCLDTLEESQYFCKLILDKDFMPQLTGKKTDQPKFPLQMSIGLAKALNCFVPMLCLQGLLRYLYKTVLEVPVYITVKNRKGYRNLVYMIQIMMQYSFWHWTFSYLIKFGLFCVSWRQKTIAEHYRRRYSHIDYLDDYNKCPYSEKWR